jgi:hypothetical protein
MNVDRLRELFEKSNDRYVDAKNIGTSYQTMYNIIYKGSMCKVDLLKRIADYYKVPVGYFFDEDAQLISGNQSVLVGRDNNGGIDVNSKRELDNALSEVKFLKAELDNKNKLLEEKERLINVLLKKE